MNNIELILTIEEGRVRARIGKGAECSSDINNDDLRRNTVEIFMDWLRRSAISKRKELEILGTHLYKILFHGPVEDLFLKTYQNVVSADIPIRLRIQLSFDRTARDLASMPWEYLYFPGHDTARGFFLSTNTELVLSRFMPLSEDRQALAPDSGPLRILIVVSQPQDLGPVAAEQVIEDVFNKMDKYKTAISTFNRPTIKNFLEEIEKHKPHVLHFIGHGKFDEKEKEGKIALLEPEGQNVAWIGDKEFADIFYPLRSRPHLIFLHLCEGAVVDLDANFSGLAPQLIRSKIRAVVAMQYPITNRAAISFSKEFYDKLSAGKPVDDAVQHGRYAMICDDQKARDSRVFGTPVLYMNSIDGVIILPAEEKEKSNNPPGRSLPVKIEEIEVPKDNKRRLEQRNPPEELFDIKKVTNNLQAAPPKNPFSKIRYEAELQMDKMNLKDLEKNAIKNEIKKIEEKLNSENPDNWRDILINYWDETPEGDLKNVLRHIVSTLKSN